MKIKAVILVFLILFSAVLPIQAATDEGYGEAETSLGQFVDSFEDLENVSVAVNVIRNATLDTMELNSTTASTGIYNLTQLREHDYFGGAATPDFTWTINNNDEIRMISDAASQGRGYMFLTVNRLWLDDKYIRFRYFPFADVVLPTYQTQSLTVYDGNYDRSNGADFPSAAGGAPWNPIPLKGNGILFSYTNVDGLNNWFTKDFQIDTSGGTEDNVTLFWWFRDDWTARTLHLRLDWIEINNGAGGADNLIFINFNNSSPITMEQVGTQGDYGFSFNPELPFQVGGFETEGYFTTVDYLSDPLANGSALTALFNSTIPANTQILVEFSEDNSTWVFNDWEPLFGGFEAVDLRDLNYSSGFYFRYNLSTTDFSVTPRVYQSRLITTMGRARADVNITGEWVEYNLTSITVNVGTHDSGNLASTFFVDGDTYDVSETVGTPAWIISFNWTNVDQGANSLWVLIYSFYDGNLVHDIDLQLYNFTSTSWTDIAPISDMLGFEWVNASIYDLRIPNDFINSTGAVLGRINHLDSGNINHDMLIDLIQLQAFIPSDVEVEIFQFFWIVIAIALMIVGIVLARMWPHDGDP